MKFRLLSTERGFEVHADDKLLSGITSFSLVQHENGETDLLLIAEDCEYDIILTQVENGSETKTTGRHDKGASGGT